MRQQAYLASSPALSVGTFTPVMLVHISIITYSNFMWRAPVVRKVNNAIHRMITIHQINHYPKDKC